MRKHLLFFLLLFFSVPVSAAEYWNVTDVPNTRLQSDLIHISDPDDWVTSEYEMKINSVLDSLRADADVFVVVLSSIGDQSIEMFATDLFNYWGIGDAELDNGLLMLMVEDQHKLRFETGYGLESELPDATCQKIFMQVIVPYFKNGDYNGGLYAGACAVAGILGSLPDDSQVTMDQIASLKSSGYEEDGGSEFSDDDAVFLWVYLGLAVLVGVFFIVRLVKKARQIDPQNASLDADDLFSGMKKDGWIVFFLMLLCCPLLPLAIAYLIVIPVLKKKYRNTPRVCTCGRQMRKLSEQEEDVYMTENQVFEEGLGVKDFDVWVCDSCGNKRIVQNTKGKAALYYTCPRCHCLAGKNKYNTTVIEATTSHDGEGLRHIECLKCGYTYTQSYVIPKKRETSSSSSGSGSSHHSSGGSFGGGHSGGGGYTGSW